MKVLQLITLVLCLALVTEAQVDRSKAPQAGPPPKVEIGKHKSFIHENGLKVYVVENHKLPKVSMSIRLDIDPIAEGDAVGYVSMVGQMLMAGTRERSKETLNEEIDFIGASLNASSRGLYASGLSKHKNKLFDLASDILLNPAFQDEELEKLKTKDRSGLQYAKTDPGSIMSNVKAKFYYGEDHPYGEIQKEEHLDHITLSHIQNYYSENFRPGAAYMAIVGDITLKEAKELVNRYFSDWENADIVNRTYKLPQAPQATRLIIADKPGAVQSSISIGYPVQYSLNSPDYLAGMMMSNILGGGIFNGRLIQNLREDKAFTYGANCSLSQSKQIGNFNSFADVRTEVTDSAVTEFLYEIKNMAESGITKAELSSMKKFQTGVFAIQLESPQTIANRAINLARYNLPEDFYSTYLERLDNLTIEEVNAAAKKYLKPHHLNIIIVGDKDKISDKLRDLLEIKPIVVDGYGDLLKEVIPIPEGMTAKKVIEGYIDAIGGNDKLGSVKAMSYTAIGSVQGQDLEMKAKYLKPNYFAKSVSMAGQIVQKTLYNGKSNAGFSMSMQGKKEMSQEELSKAKEESVMFAEASYLTNGYSLELSGVKELNNSQAYILKVVSPGGEERTEYYDIKSGFKVRSETTVESPQGTFTVVSEHMDYKEVDGVSFPHTLSQGFGPQTIKFEITSFEINPKISKKEFKL